MAVKRAWRYTAVPVLGLLVSATDSGSADLASLQAQLIFDYDSCYVDQFCTKSLTGEHAGERVVVGFPVGDGSQHGGPSGAFYTYRDGKLLIVLGSETERESFPNRFDGHNYFEGIITNRKTSKRVDTRHLQTGMKISYTVEHERQLGISINDNSFKRSKMFSLPMDPEDARYLSKRLFIRAKGIVAEGKYPGVCGKTYIDSIVNSMREIFVTTCFIKLNQVEFELWGPDGKIDAALVDFAV